ncbi:ArsR/SmtB family transcription factor [Geminicoccus roseus]|uniref:ArsR/SmtB family transcription factor n=1 Tax=Geminicoccus roseus TaxID=404900 RepID=UPI00041BD624|nr:metalloregulator ArsR/SmtB family transcription factor [Geminicoccus roseus]
MQTVLVAERAERATRLLRVMANEHRLAILCRIAGAEQSVGELARQTGLSQSAISQHLARLRREDLVRTRRDAQTVWYSLASGEAREMIATLDRLFGGRPQAAAHLAGEDGVVT